MSKTVELTVPDVGAGQRVDRWLAKARIGLSRNRLQTLIEDGRVCVNGRVARQALKLKEGDRVTVEVPPRRPSRLFAEPVPLTIVHEDEFLIVLEKPAGIVVHPGAGVQTGTLVHALLHHVPSIAGVGGEGRPGIVHRLDKDTSGLMVVAKTENTYLALVEALRKREVSRVYHAIVWGDPGPSEGLVDMAIGRDQKERTRMAVVTGTQGKPARTRWRVLERFGPATLLEARLETGRTHQIRVHFSALRHPVVGDPVYGGRVRKSLSLRQSERSLADALLRNLRRQALHATELELTHPETGERLRFTSALPEDFSRALELLRAFPAYGSS